MAGQILTHRCLSILMVACRQGPVENLVSFGDSWWMDGVRSLG